MTPTGREAQTATVFNAGATTGPVGIPVPFLELDLGEDESWFVACLARAGLRGDMMGCPDRQGGHRVAWIVDGLEPAAAQALAASLAERYAEVHTVAAGTRWVGTGRILDGMVASPALHAYIDVEDRFEAPWINVDGTANLRLLPRSDMDLLVDQAKLQRALRARGSVHESRIRSFQLGRYETLRDTLRAAVLGEACRDVGPAVSA